MRYVVLHHTGWNGRSDHYDLLLELVSGGARLKTFSTLEDVFPDAGREMKLIQTHRRAYLSYEGPVSRGRGQVARVDEGEIINWTAAGLRELAVQFAGRQLNGRFCLRLCGARIYVFEELP